MENIISIQGLSMSYGSKQVLDDINLEVNKGQVIGYIGPNGAGKSTTVKIMLGLVSGYTGQVKIFGKDISGGDIEYKRRIGYVPEVAEIYDNLTAREYLLFIAELYGLSESKAISKIKQLISSFSLDEVIDSRITSFSKGMKQKILIISSLVHNPDILFLDEPLAGLDANSVIIIKELLAILASSGKTVFYSSHIMDVVEKISDRIILLKDGKIVADGSFEELKSRSNEGTLEQIFNELTGFNQHKEIANFIMQVVEE